MVATIINSEVSHDNVGKRRVGDPRRRNSRPRVRKWNSFEISMKNLKKRRPLKINGERRERDGSTKFSVRWWEVEKPARGSYRR